MFQTKCINGHYYDMDQYILCPICGAKSIESPPNNMSAKKAIDMNALQNAINEIFPGLAMLVRDVNLSDICSSKYTPGMIIRELGYTDASFRIGGMVTTHRYTILSNHMANLSGFENKTNWGLCVANRDAHFKILDIYKYQGKTQIILLHLPDDRRWKLFDNVVISIEEELVKTCRSKFCAKCKEKAIPELATDEWLIRCTEPLGMNRFGKMFPLE